MYTARVLTLDLRRKHCPSTIREPDADEDPSAERHAQTMIPIVSPAQKHLSKLGHKTKRPAEHTGQVAYIPEQNLFLPTFAALTLLRKPN